MNPLSVIVRIKTKTSRLCKRIHPALQSPPPHFLANCCAICFQYFPVFSGLFGPKENCYLISFSSQITWEKPKADTRTANRIPGYPGSPLIRGVVEICGGSPVIRE